MNTANALTIALLVLGGALAAEVPAARAAPLPEHSRALLFRPANRIVGTWEYEVHIFRCDTGQTLVRSRAASVFNAGGTMLDTSTAPPNSRGPAFGVWSYDPRTREHVIRMRLYRYNPDGSFAGATEVTRTARISLDGNRMTETFTGKILNPDEQVLLETCGTGEGVRSL